VKRIVLALPAVWALACSSAGVTVDVTLAPPNKASLSPFDAAARLSFVRVQVDGSERLDEAAVDLAPGAQAASFVEFPVDREVRVIATGYDELGNVAAYGEAEAVVESDDLAVAVPFRRALAYVIHRDICDGGCGEGFVCANPGDGHRCLAAAACECRDGEVCGVTDIGAQCVRPYGGASAGARRVYAIDLNTKALVDVLSLPVPDARAVSITAESGDGVWVTLEAPTQSSAVFLSSSTHEWSAPLPLQLGAEHSMSARGLPYVVGSGGGFIRVVDRATGAQVTQVPVGGRVRDGVIGGNDDKALVVTSETLALLDLEDPASAVAVNPGDLPGSSGAALSADRRFAYVTSSVDGTVIIFDLVLGSSRVLGGQFVVPVQNLVYSQRGEMLLGILTSEPSVFVGAFNVPDQVGLPVDKAVGTLPLPTGVAVGPAGARVIVVSAGTSTGSAGLTLVDPVLGEEPTGSTVSYLRDPTETYVERGATLRQRFRPYKVAALYGQ
jgi:DNA-binding beta-propeller fold protein YncE